jgi:hypothetical protein
VLTAQQEQMIQSDPRLRELNSSPDTASKTQGIISDNPQVFTATDNPAVKNQLLGDMGIASNGMKFADMEKMSAEEMNKLSPQIQEEFAAWGEKNNQQLDQAVVSLGNKKEQLDQAVLLKKAEDATLDKVMISKEQTLKEIETSLPAISKQVEIAKKSLSSSGKSLIDSELEKTRNDPNNPVNDTLRKS